MLKAFTNHTLVSFFRIIDLMPGKLIILLCICKQVGAPSQRYPHLPCHFHFGNWTTFFFLDRQLVGSMFQSQPNRKWPPQHPPHIAYLWLQGRSEVYYTSEGKSCIPPNILFWAHSLKTPLAMLQHLPNKLIICW
jgi:hypothetical protein